MKIIRRFLKYINICRKMKNRMLITICGRGGSKGVPGKNIRPINGKPLIGYSIEVANLFASKFNGKISLSTDSDEIKKVAADFGLITDYKRPSELASDAAGKIDVLRDLLLFTEKTAGHLFDFVLDLDITSPLRTMEDLTGAYQLLINNPEAINLFSVSPARKNPYFNMVEVKPDGYVELVKKIDNTILSRQKAPKVYDMNASFYFYRRRFFDEGYKSALTPKSMIFEMPGTCFDIDDESEFQIMKYLIENNLVKTK